VTLLVAALFGLAQPEQRPLFRVSTDAVQVDVFARLDGRAVAGLRASDFEIYDDGVLRPVDSVALAEVSLNVVLSLDVSQSVEGETLSHLRRAADSFLEALSPEDRAGLLTFSHHLNRHSGLVLERAPLRQALEAVEASGGTAWHDALFAALEMLEPIRERPMVLLFTDGADTYSWLREEQVLPLVSRSNPVVYAITRREAAPLLDLRTARAQERFRQNRREELERTKLLRQVTRESGGRLIETESAARLREIFLEILAEMKTRYILTFTPTAPVREGWHDLEVKVKRKGVEVQARRGYYYEPAR
jgi:VWFA-related protein